MTTETKTWICTGCLQQFVAGAALQPPDWQWYGSHLLCQDCVPTDRRCTQGRVQSNGGAADMRFSAFDAATANLIRNGVARDLADPDNARIAA